MRNAHKGEWIRNTYEVLQVFPLQLGTLYFTRFHPDPTKTDVTRADTRFILAVPATSQATDAPLAALLERDESRFVSVEAVFVEEETMYWVYRRMPSTWLAYRLLSNHRVPEREIPALLQQVVRTWMQVERNDEWTFIHPENLFLEDSGQVRFLYGGPAWLTRPPLFPPNEGVRLGLLAYSLLTGRRMPLHVPMETLLSLPEDPVVPNAWKSFLRQMCQASSTNVPSWDKTLELLEQTSRTLSSPETPGRGHAATDPATVTAKKASSVSERTSPAPHVPTASGPWWKRRAVRLGAAAIGGLMLLTATGWGITQMFVSNSDRAALSPSQSKQAAIWYNQSLAAYQAKQYDRALELGKKALAADPSKQGYYLHVAKLHQIQGDFQNGVQVMKQAVKRFPQDPAMQDGLAMQSYYAKDFMAAKAASDKAVQMNPSNPGYFYHNGKILAALGDYAHAAEMLKKAIALDNRQPYYHYDLSVYQYRLGQIDPAIQSAKTASGMDGDNPRYKMMLGILYLKKRELANENPSLLPEEKEAQKRKWAQEAVRVFDPLVKKHELNEGGYYYASVAFYYAGRLPEAANAIQQALKANNRHALYHYHYGVVLAASGKRNEAIAQFQQAVRLEPNHPLYKKALDQLQK
ncbi:tetratricopeptide repeat protein [Polycladomyces sp. WAk]|uniref:Tetratricopeptide repeat protein n=1 Tax=Polycladomyces zharkentensis TaxID=2807616 RepID=A0ABS2WM58_9BACL|nr:tetratricopeptide repeat protein [Polycladomyces sp. WAk]MBN2910536.1 tetratricopeptide repeat protein [Polycladomyces sp. WAk]